MSLLMDALKKAEQAKKKVSQNDAVVAVEKGNQPPKSEVTQQPVIKMVDKSPAVSVSDTQLDDALPPQDNILKTETDKLSPTVVDDEDNLDGLTLMEVSGLDEVMDISLPADNENRVSEASTLKLKDEIIVQKSDIELEGKSSVKKEYENNPEHEGNHFSPAPPSTVLPIKSVPIEVLSSPESGEIKPEDVELTSITPIKEPEVSVALPLGKLPERDRFQESPPTVKSAKKFTTPPIVGIGANKLSRRQQAWGVVGVVFILVLGAIFTYFNSILGGDNQPALIAADQAPVESQETKQVMINNSTVVDISPAGLFPVEATIKSSVVSMAQKELPAATIAPQKKVPPAIDKQPEQNNQQSVVTKPVSRTNDRSAALQITRTERRDPLEVVLQTAYQAYQEGSYKTAEDKYRQALRFDGANRDARLGLAVISQRTGRVESARTFYKSLLALNPKDSIALTGLMSLPGGSGSKQNESRIKLMLDEEPTAAHLHFTLGIEYVAQGRWAAAQQSFFQAYRSAPENADYSYNLAVSLEQLSQPRTALDYYRQAKQLSSGQVVGFGAEQLDLRIESLSAAGKVQ